MSVKSDKTRQKIIKWIENGRLIPVALYNDRFSFASQDEGEVNKVVIEVSRAGGIVVSQDLVEQILITGKTDEDAEVHRTEMYDIVTTVQIPAVLKWIPHTAGAMHEALEKTFVPDFINMMKKDRGYVR